MKTTAQSLRRFAASDRYVTVRRRFPNATRVEGFVVAVSAELALVQRYEEFRFDGYSAVRLADVRKVEADRCERLFKTILEKEGTRRPVELGCNLSLASWRTLLVGLSERDGPITLEHETRDPDDDLFLIGRVARVGERSLLLRGFDVEGRWQRPERVAFSKITSLHFATHYGDTFMRHVR